MADIHSKDCNIYNIHKNLKCNCDGYHTFDELYEHRSVLFILLAKNINNVWYSLKHSDGTSYDGWFIVGIGKESGRMITYHLPDKYLNDVRMFAEYLEFAPEWDGHTSFDVIERIKTLYKEK